MAVSVKLDASAGRNISGFGAAAVEVSQAPSEFASIHTSHPEAHDGLTVWQSVPVAFGGQTSMRALRLTASERAKLRSLASRLAAELSRVLLTNAESDGAPSPRRIAAIEITTINSTMVKPDWRLRSTCRYVNNCGGSVDGVSAFGRMVILWMMATFILVAQ
jgi:hypothetical protein